MSTTVCEDEYLELLKRCLTASLYDEVAWTLVREVPVPKSPLGFARAAARNALVRFARSLGVVLVAPKPYSEGEREAGGNWPLFGYTMTGLARLNILQSCVEDVVSRGIPGDLVETGVWRGGSAIFMRAMLKRLGVTDRTVWAADSFEGLPAPDPKRSPLAGEADLSRLSFLKVSLEQVRANFRRFSLLDDQVCFLKGWFKDTLAAAPIERISILRLDGDLYESTMDALVPLYPKVSPGGYVIVDDYYSWPGCRRAVDEYRSRNGITAELNRVDWTCGYWQVPG